MNGTTSVRRSFTLLELLTVVVIIILLVSMSMPMLNESMERGERVLWFWVEYSKEFANCKRLPKISVACYARHTYFRVSLVSSA